jgi:hypothetical protein
LFTAAKQLLPLQFSSPCLAIDNGWYMGNVTHMLSMSTFMPDDNKHEGMCSGDLTLGMVSD